MRQGNSSTIDTKVLFSGFAQGRWT